jgi:membrane protein implicated in regulation of membrane protease activity
MFELMGLSGLLNGSQTVYLACALAGTALLLFKILLGSVFGDGDGHGADGDAAHSHGTEASFQLFSLYSITGFIMMFGWAGLAALNQYQLSDFTSLIIALAVGIFTSICTAGLLHMTDRLTSHGANFKIEQTVGHTGTVYQKIPGAGRGVVQLSVNGVLRELDAVSIDGQEIASFTNVFVEKVLDAKTVLVKPVHP